MVLGIIPARLDSTRFPHKILAPILGKPMIQRVWDKARASSIDALVVATDALSIFSVVRGFGGEAILTPSHFQSGTDRVAWTARQFACDLVVDIQGDEPLLDPRSINALIQALQTAPFPDMATLAVRSSLAADATNPNVVKVIFDESRHATGFVRSLPAPAASEFWKHLGIYAFYRESLFRFSSLPMTTLEKRERLEQLRALENGMRIRVVEAERDTIAVDLPGDIARVEQAMKEL